MVDFPKNFLKPCLLLVDDDPGHRGMLNLMLSGWGYDLLQAAEGGQALKILKDKLAASTGRPGSASGAHDALGAPPDAPYMTGVAGVGQAGAASPPDAVLMDLRMEGMDGISTLREIKALAPELPVLIMTAYSSLETAVEALRLGAYDYLTKPLDFDELKLTLERAVEHARLKLENKELRAALNGANPDFLGNSAPMRELRIMISTVAPTEATVLIEGESGSGKELVARALHKASRRKDKPLVLLNCAALSDNLLESELFGHEKGSFTGADKMREGRFMQADGATLFLDEIGEIPPALQPKLLRALQQGEIQRVGSDKIIHIDTRVIAATNRDLREEIKAGRFREDLYFRLNVISLKVPPLRGRKEDIPLLAMHFLKGFSLKNRKHISGFRPETLKALAAYNWPGNVRELENSIERAVIMTSGSQVELSALPVVIREEYESGEPGDNGKKRRGSSETPGRNPNQSPNQSVDQSVGRNPGWNITQAEPGANAAGLGGISLEELERRAMRATLEQTGGNRSESARILGITRATLLKKMKLYGLVNEIGGTGGIGGIGDAGETGRE